MRFNRLFAITAFGAIGLAACGSATASNTAKHAAPSPTTAAPATVASDAVKTGNTALGVVLTSTKSLTLYGFTHDTPDASACSGSCAQVWPPLIVAKGWTVPSGLDKTLFHVIIRSDGSHQLAAGKWPLYTYAGDTAAGDVKGEGVEGFFAAGTNGKLVKNAPASAPTTAPATTMPGY